jgi:hypothetical protein
MAVLKIIFKVIFAAAALVLLVEALRDLSAAKALLGVVMLAMLLRVR